MHMRTQMSLRVLLVFVALNTALACATTPPPSPLNTESSVIGIKVNVRGFKLFSTPSERVYFVRIDEGVLLSQEGTIASNYSQDGYVYLVNAEPGRYAAVAASHSRPQPTTAPGVPVAGGGHVTVTVSLTTISWDTIYFPTGLIQKTAVTVGPGAAAFMGDLVVDGSGLGGADGAQLYYLRLVKLGMLCYHPPEQVIPLLPDAEVPFGIRASGPSETACPEDEGGRNYKGSEHKIDQSTEAQQKFFKRSRKLMADTGWASVLQNPVRAAPPD